MLDLVLHIEDLDGIKHCHWKRYASCYVDYYWGYIPLDCLSMYRPIRKSKVWDPFRFNYYV